MKETAITNSTLIVIISLILIIVQTSMIIAEDNYKIKTTRLYSLSQALKKEFIQLATFIRMIQKSQA